MFSIPGQIVSMDSDLESIIINYSDIFDEIVGAVLYPEYLAVKLVHPVPIAAEYFLNGDLVGFSDRDFLFEKILVNDIDTFFVRPYARFEDTVGRADDYLELLTDTLLTEDTGFAIGAQVMVTLYREHWWGGSQTEF